MFSLTRLDDDRSEVSESWRAWNPLSLSAPALVKLLKWVFQGGLEQLASEYGPDKSH